MATVNYTPDGRMVVALSPHDIEVIAATVQSEVGHFGKYGEEELERAVAAVTDTITNRVASGTWGGTVEEVVNAPGQFSAISGSASAVGSWDNLRSPSAAVTQAVQDHLYNRYMGAPSIVSDAMYFSNPAITLGPNSEASASTQAAHGAMYEDAVNRFGNPHRNVDYHLHGTLPGGGTSPDYMIGQVADNPLGYAVSETGSTFGTMAYSPERPSVKSPQPAPEPPALGYAPEVDIASTDFLAGTLDASPESYFGGAPADMSALSGYGIPGGFDLSGPPVATSRAPVESATPPSIAAPPSLSPLSAPAPQMPSGPSLEMSPEARPSMAPSVTAPAPQSSLSAPGGLMSVPADMQTMFGEPSMPTSFSPMPSMPAAGMLSPVAAPAATGAVPPSTGYMGEDVYGFGLSPVESMPSDAEIAAMLGGASIPSPSLQTASPAGLEASIFGAPTAPSSFSASPSIPAPGSLSPSPAPAALPPASAPAPTMPAALSPGPTTTTAPPFGAPAPAPKPAPAAPQAPMPAPSIPTVTSPAAGIPTVSGPAPGGFAPPTVAAASAPQHRGLKAPPSKKDLPGLIAGTVLGGLPGAVLGVAAPRVAGSIGNLFGSMGGAAVPMGSGSGVSVTQVGSGLYKTSLGNVVDVSGNPADVMKQPGGKEALAAAGAASLAGSGLHEPSRQAQEAMANNPMGGLW